MYLFTKSPGVYVFGKTPDSECASGKYRIEPSQDRATISIIQVETGISEYKDRLVTSFLKSNGVAYANFTELQAGYGGFFQNDSFQSSQPLPTGAATAEKQTDGTQKTQVVDSAGAQLNVGVCNGCVAAVLSDAVDLAQPGYIQPRLLAGNIKVTDVAGNVSTLAFDQKETSLFRVKRVWSTGTTANMGIVVLY